MSKIITTYCPDCGSKTFMIDLDEGPDMQPGCTHCHFVANDSFMEAILTYGLFREIKAASNNNKPAAVVDSQPE